MTKEKITIFNYFNKKKSFNKKRNSNKNYYIGPWSKNNINFNYETMDDCLKLNEIQNKKGYYKNIDIILKKYNIYLNFLSKQLNKIHNKNYSKKTWETIIGRWLLTLLSQIYFLWDYYEKINKKYIVKNYFFLKVNPSILIPENSHHSHNIVRGDNIWYNWIFEQIIKFREKGANIKYQGRQIKKMQIKKIKTIIPRSFSLFKSSKFLFYNLIFDNLFKFEIMIKNISFNFSFRGKYLKFSKTKLDRFKVFSGEGKNLISNFDKFFYNILIYNIPRSFLEHFEYLDNYSNKIKWPKNPKFILSSYGQYYDEIFKIYCAKKRQFLNSKLIILQHGYGGIFKKKDFFNFYYDRKISDFFLSWGTNKKWKGLALFFPKTNIKKKFNTYNNKNILMISYSFSSFPFHGFDGLKNGNQINFENFEKISFFLDNFNKTSINNIFLRNLEINKSLSLSIKQKYPSLNFVDMHKVDYLNSLKKFKLTIHFHIGTPLFEAFYLKMPSIIIYNKNSHPIYDTEFSKMINKLKKRNILFYDSKSAIKFLDSNYDTILMWWKTKKVQNVIEEFCKMYCFESKLPIKNFQERVIKNL